LEFTATPDASPRYIFVGSWIKSATESKGITGTAVCAKACEQSKPAIAATQVFIEPPRGNPP
jgi:hypothetical protein